MIEPAMIRGNHCTVHKYHWPPPQRTVKHHILPLEFGGPDIPGNLRLTCDTGHYNIHQAITDLRAGRTPKGTRKELELAQTAVDWIEGSRAIGG
jgi:hypothetical protein